jgi:hypothetical protein
MVCKQQQATTPAMPLKENTTDSVPIYHHHVVLRTVNYMTVPKINPYRRYRIPHIVSRSVDFLFQYQSVFFFIVNDRINTFTVLLLLYNVHSCEVLVFITLLYVHLCRLHARVTVWWTTKAIIWTLKNTIRKPTQANPFLIKPRRCQQTIIIINNPSPGPVKRTRCESK